MKKKTRETLFRIAAGRGRPVFGGMLWYDLPNGLLIEWTRQSPSKRRTEGYYTLTEKGKRLVSKFRRQKAT